MHFKTNKKSIIHSSAQRRAKQQHRATAIPPAAVLSRHQLRRLVVELIG